MKTPKLLSLTTAKLVVLTLTAIGSANLARAYTNPIITNTRDPDCRMFDGKYHLIEPAGGVDNGGSYKYRSSKNLVTWSAVTTIFKRPSGTALWQGHMMKHTDGKVYLYYTAVDDASNKTIGVASATSPTGSYTDHGRLITASGGIDPFPFVDTDGSIWLFYKDDAAGQKNIWVQRLSDPKTKYSGYNPKLCIDPQPGTWEDNGYVSAEGPCMIKLGSTYFLLYTGGPYGQKTYAIGYGYASAPDGPFTKYSGNPIVSNLESPNVYSPGVPTIVTDNVGAYWMVYRQRINATTGSARQITIDPLNVSQAGSNIIDAVGTNGVSQPNPAPLP